MAIRLTHRTETEENYINTVFSQSYLTWPIPLNSSPMNKILFFILSITTLMFISCRKELDVSLDPSDQRMVVNALFAEDSNFYFQISHSTSALGEENPEPLKGATIVVTSSDGHTETISEVTELTRNYETREYYISNTKVDSKLSYEIAVSHPDYESVYATADLPTKVQISKIDTASRLNQGYPELQFTISFEDPKDIENFYEIQLYSLNWEPAYDSNFNIIGLQQSLYPLYYYLDSDGLFTYSNGTFKDELFDGENYSVTLNVSAYYFEDFDIPDTLAGEYSNKVIVELRNISREYYNYQESVHLYYMTEGDPFAEPVQIISNIEGGLGIFAGYSSSLDTLNLQ